jgi:hypothetical protein
MHWSPLARCVMALGLAAVAHAAVQPPLDVYGRPLEDERGRISYAWRGDGWEARHEDGRVTPAEGPAPRRASAFRPKSHSTYSLGPHAARNPGSAARAVAIGDVTGDRRADVVMTTTSAADPVNAYRVFVFAQEPNGSLAAPDSYGNGYLVRVRAGCGLGTYGRSGGGTDLRFVLDDPLTDPCP